MKLNPKQKEVLRYYHKYKPKHLILHGAVRSGKTFFDNILFLYEVHKHKGEKRNYIITGHTVGSIERNVLQTIGEQANIRIKLDKYNSFNLSGNKIHCFGAERADSYMAMTGMTGHGWYANEVVLQHNNSIQEAFSRISGEDSFVLWDTNSDYPDHPIKIDYIDKSEAKFKDGRVRLKAFPFKLSDNEFLPDDYIENLEATTPEGMWRDRKIKGLWVAAEGVVFENWDRNIHVIEPFKIPGNWRRYRSIDWGWNNPFCCLWGTLNDDILYIYKEHYKGQMLIKDHASVINNFTEYKDEEKKNKINYIVTVADHDIQDNMEIKEYGIHTTNAIKDKGDNVSIQKIAERLIVQGNKKPKLYVFDTCSNLIREMGKYRWPEYKEGKAEKELPIKIDDHAVDALRYMVREIDQGQVRIADAGMFGF